MNINPCANGNHPLIVILDGGSDENRASPVVRWCTECGAVVVDVDFDGRTHPGKIMPMKFPNVLRGLK